MREKEIIILTIKVRNNRQEKRFLEIKNKTYPKLDRNQGKAPLKLRLKGSTRSMWLYPNQFQNLLQKVQKPYLIFTLRKRILFNRAKERHSFHQTLISKVRQAKQFQQNYYKTWLKVSRNQEKAHLKTQFKREIQMTVTKFHHCRPECLNFLQCPNPNNFLQTSQSLLLTLRSRRRTLRNRVKLNLSNHQKT